jgi:DNA-directed RNA polymerase subunit N (RpoN/RPB10)
MNFTKDWNSYWFYVKVDMLKIFGNEGSAFPLSSPIVELTATCTSSYNHRAVGFRNCESAFHLASKILGGWDIIEEFVAANIWLISYGWAPTEILFFNINWAAQEVPFPQFGIQLPEDRSANDFMDEIEKKVNAMIGKSTMNEYKAFKDLVKHKKRINRVFSEVCVDKSFCSRRPGIKKRAPAFAVASCSSEPPKTSKRSSSKKMKGCDDGTSFVTVCPEKTKSLESNKQKHRSTEGVSDAKL